MVAKWDNYWKATHIDNIRSYYAKDVLSKWLTNPKKEFNNKIKQSTERKNTMFDFNMGNMFNGMFGKVEKGKCALTMNGGIAVRTSNGFKTYNLKKKRLTNVTNFCFDASDFFFVMPTAKVKIGDVILVGGKPKCVINISEEAIKVIDYENSEIREVVPERHIFMGSTYFYGKIVSLFGATGTKGKGFMGKIMQLMMMKSMMGGNTNDNGGGLMQMMLMQQFFNGNENGNMFENMFDLQFDTDAVMPDTDDDDDDNTEEA